MKETVLCSATLISLIVVSSQDKGVESGIFQIKHMSPLEMMVLEVSIETELLAWCV